MVEDLIPKERALQHPKAGERYLLKYPPAGIYECFCVKR
jgi:hypothetical protein